MGLTDRTAARAEDVEAVADAVRENARPLRDADDLDPLVDAIGDASYVLLGEASHGTSEFYRWRSRLTARLIREQAVDYVAVEGDWTDCYEVNRYVKGLADDEHAPDVLDAFDRWPTWMWANWEVSEFVDWLREHNTDRPEDERVGFYGMDVYSLFESMAAVVEYLEDVDPEAAARARDAYNCFEPYGDDAREYGRSMRLVPESCEDEVVETLSELRHLTATSEDGPDAEFVAEQNALVARNAEAYYRAMGRGDAESWNVRDHHMVETVERLMDHHGSDATGVVWAHNTHVGDARATDMNDRDRVNVGQLVREAHDDEEVAVVGFGTHRGEVVAADSWSAELERLSVPPAREGSHGDAFHRADVGDALVLFDEFSAADRDALADPRGQRAIGVVYDPSRELGNYVPTALPERYDAFVHVDESTALHPLGAEPDAHKEPEAYPWGV